jgi:hypothetical protein
MPRWGGLRVLKMLIELVLYRISGYQLAKKGDGGSVLDECANLVIYSNIMKRALNVFDLFQPEKIGYIVDLVSRSCFKSCPHFSAARCVRTCRPCVSRLCGVGLGDRVLLMCSYNVLKMWITTQHTFAILNRMGK